MTFHFYLPHAPLRVPISRLLAHGFALLALMFALPAYSVSLIIPPSERAVLLNLYASTNGAGWTNKTGWNGAAVGTECTWFGVTCNAGNNNVTQIQLPTNNLTGSLPDISALSALTQFQVYKNQLTGNIPTLTGLSGLTDFVAYDNKLTGSIPPLSGLTALQYFDVSNNKLTGSIPSLSGLTSLQNFDVDTNLLTGSIPALNGLSAMKYFYAHHNLLTGNIPALTGLTALSDFYVNDNLLTGTIPALTGLSALYQFDVSNNQLTGSLPAVPSPVNALVTGRSHLCPNLLTVSVNLAWDAATGSTPWSTDCSLVAALPTVSIGNVSIVEGNVGTSVMNFPITLSAPAPAGGVTITYSTVDGTATAGSGDYVSVINGSATIAAGLMSGFLPVTINGDTAIEANETFTVQMISATNATLGLGTTNPINIGTGTILNDDANAVTPLVSVPVNSPWWLLVAMLGVLVVRRKLN